VHYAFAEFRGARAGSAPLTPLLIETMSMAQSTVLLEHNIFMEVTAN